LACRTIPLHFSLSNINSLHLLTPSTWWSLSASPHSFLVLRYVNSWNWSWYSYSCIKFLIYYRVFYLSNRCTTRLL
jgi:hypothetical protein